MTSTCLVLPGAGTALGVVAGAVEAIGKVHTFAAVGGTSGGGLVALALAFGMEPRAVSELVGKMLQRTDLLDKGWPFDASPGLFRGKVIEKLLRETFGDARMRELKIPCRVCVVDLATGKPAIVDSVVHGDVLVWRAARATMAIEFFFDPIQLRADNARTYGDGGLALNVPAGLWDDRTESTICLRFAHQVARLDLATLIQNANGDAHYKEADVVRTWSQLAAKALAVAMHVAAGTLPTAKPGTNFLEVVLHSDGDGMKFGLTEAEASKRRVEGIRSAHAANLRSLNR